MRATHTHVHARTHARIHISPQIHTRTHSRTYTCTRARTHKLMHTRTHTCTHVCTLMYTCARTCTQMYAHACARAHTHTRVHAHGGKRLPYGASRSSPRGPDVRTAGAAMPALPRRLRFGAELLDASTMTATLGRQSRCRMRQAEGPQHASHSREQPAADRETGHQASASRAPACLREAQPRHCHRQEPPISRPRTRLLV